MQSGGDEINIILYEFYLHNNIFIDIEFIRNVIVEPIYNIILILRRIFIDDISNITRTLNSQELNELNEYNINFEHNDVCSICLDNIEKNNLIIKLKCNHIFHSSCIKEYLKNYNRNCPICKIDL